jgi:NADH-quinone oxidoreductase subunit A
VTLDAYLPVILMLIVAVGFGVVMLYTSWKIAPNKPTPEKLAPYECGIVPLQEPAERFPVKFYVVAMLFVIFDVEIIFLIAFASRFGEFGWAGVAGILVFIALLFETLVYAWKRGALDWNVARRARYRGVAVEAAPLEEAA